MGYIGDYIGDQFFRSSQGSWLFPEEHGASHGDDRPGAAGPYTSYTCCLNWK